MQVRRGVSSRPSVLKVEGSLKTFSHQPLEFLLYSSQPFLSLESLPTLFIPLPLLLLMSFRSFLLDLMFPLPKRNKGMIANRIPFSNPKTLCLGSERVRSLLQAHH